MILKNLLKKNKENNIDSLIKEGKINKIIKYLEKNNINIEENLEEYLTLAIKSKNTDFLKYLQTLNLKFPETIDNLNILSFALSITSNLDIISLIIKSELFSKEYKYGLTPCEMALEKNYDYELFKVLIDNDILENSPSRLPFLHQLIESNEIEDTTRGAIFVYLLEKKKDVDLNQEALNTDPLIVKAYKKEEYTLLSLFLVFGARLKFIANEYEEIFDQKDMKALSSVLLEKQPKEDYKYFVPYLNYEDLETFINSLQSTKDMQILLYIAKNILLNNAQKINIFKLALEKGCDINETSDDIEEENVIQYICRSFVFGKNLEVVKFLFEEGAIFNLNKKQPLVFCINGNETHLIKYLVEEQNININELNHAGEGAINGFIDYTYLDTVDKQIEMFELLVELGLDINQKVIGKNTDEYPKSSIIDILMPDKNNHALLKYILKNHTNLEISQSISFMFKNELDDETCKIIIDKNPTYEIESYFEKEFNKNSYKYNAEFLDMAIDWQRYEVAQYILDNYPQIKGYNENISLIFLAFNKEFSLEFIKKLILKDPNLNREYKSEDKFGTTITQTSLIQVLRYTIKNEQIDYVYKIIEFLIENGADASIPLRKHNIADYYLDEEGALICGVLFDEIPFKLFDLLIEKGNINPNKPVSNLNQTQIQSLLYSRDIQDEHKFEALKYFHNKCGLDLQHLDRKGYNLFLKASSNCLPKCLQYLIELGSDIHIVGGEDNSPAIHKAISNYYFVDKTKRAQTVKVLIDAGVDLEQFDSEQLTALMSASKYGCFESLVTLLENGANPNSKNETNANAANVLITEDYQRTEHFYSYDDKENFEENKSKILAVLKDYGCDLDNVPLEGSTILNNAIGYNLKTIFNTLLQLDIDINKPDKNGTTPIMVAIEFGDIYFVNSLLQNPNINLLVEDNAGENLIYKAIKRENDSKVIDLIDYLVENGVPIKNLENGMNPLIFASYFSHFNLFEYLLNFVDDINTKDSFGLSAISWTLQSNLNIPLEQRLEAIKTLVALNADINDFDTHGRTAFHYCVYTHNDLVFDYLIKEKKQIDINKKDAEGNSPITLLILNYFNNIYKDNIDFFEYFFTKLVSNGADIQDAKLFIEKYEDDDYLKSFVESF
ncbi:hypothetical protein CPU12_07775 [Malaciobacter molluscorum LMG 25693]|uniref:Ankyrin domain-containing protein n=1 Tax=Malaciobacter molluscorum LMG 25693 TaxID=870501 RepID=A0A2G1DI12_9BACT|nr:ankyrin repeat domain-containing protein [Malaciobacter molluscorum]AXX93332.1 ankyrin domain-containing protein [Malaciobacter molluscorum LMG 25693]PHO17986.1 hypothetical protein CPU12_07775 [Malaciobacter molluscorum LMG 25693]